MIGLELDVVVDVEDTLVLDDDVLDDDTVDVVLVVPVLLVVEDDVDVIELVALEVSVDVTVVDGDVISHP